MIKIIVMGALGRMGQRITQIIDESKISTVHAGIESPNKELPTNYIYPLSHKLEDFIGDCDVIIDFTHPSSSLRTAELARQHQKALVMGTTGFDNEEKMKLENTLKQIPAVFSPNMSVGVNVLLKLVEIATQLLAKDYDMELVEAHHKFKKDAPSGTALKIAEVAALSINKKLEDIAVYERHGIIGERKPGSLGIQTIRGGDIVGTHTLMYAGTGECIELTHRATSRDTFAKGAVVAAEWLMGKNPGIYTMTDVLGL